VLLKLARKKGSEEFATATHLILGTIIFIAVAVAVMFFFVGDKIETTFDAAGTDADKIVTRLIFSKNCLALDQTFDFSAWYGDERASPHLVRLGIIDLNKYTGPVPPGEEFGADRIKSCVGYDITKDGAISYYDYDLMLHDFEDIVSYPMNVRGDPGGNPVPADCGDPAGELNRALVKLDKIYPVLIEDGGKYHNGALYVDITFCYSTFSLS